jgi:hypothetical protein
MPAAAAAAGKGGERGVARPEVLQSLLGSCERVVQEIDSVEYGLTDIQVGCDFDVAVWLADTACWQGCSAEYGLTDVQGGAGLLAVGGVRGGAAACCWVLLGC